MKKIIALLLATVLSVSLCGCDIKSMFEDFDVSEVMSEVKNQLLVLSGQNFTEITEEYYISSPEFDSCYNALNKKQKNIYKKIYSIAEVMPTGFVKLTENYEDAIADINIAYRAVLNDHTEIFWMPDTYLLGNGIVNQKKNIYISCSYSDSENDIDYIVTKEQREVMRAALDSKVAQIAEKANEFETEFEKEKFINDYICENTEYDKEAEFSNSAYGSIIFNKALCEGYARAFKLLCNEVGIECDLIIGKTGEIGHMWNRVNIDGKHSFVDVTWSDQKNRSYAYFNITDEQIEFDHTASPLFTEISSEKVMKGSSFNFTKRECSYNGNTYYKKYGNEFNLDNENNYADYAARILDEKVAQGVNIVEFLFDSESTLKKFKNNDESFVRRIQRQANIAVIYGFSFERDVLTLHCEEYD